MKGNEMFQRKLIFSRKWLREIKPISGCFLGTRSRPSVCGLLSSWVVPSVRSILPSSSSSSPHTSLRSRQICGANHTGYWQVSLIADQREPSLLGQARLS